MKRAVITGLGAITPIGNDVENFWNNAIKGKSGAAEITHFDASEFRTQFACEVKDFDVNDHLDRKEVKSSDRFSHLGLVAAEEAIKDSGFDIEKMNPFDIGVIFGSGQGGMQTFEEQVASYATGESKRYNPYFVPKIITNMASGLISMKYGFMGINYSTVSACATGNSALMDALNFIRLGKAKIIITGGAEAPITKASIGGFSSMRAMSSRNDSPEEASRPFDIERDGFVMGEGSGVLVIEEYEHAKKRGAYIYAELVGAAMTADAYHMTATHPDGLGAIEAMKRALIDAELNADEIDYLNAHATSTPVGDLSEITAITNVFGSNSNVAISGTKSMTGHLLGAASAIEAVLSVKALKENMIPPTINTNKIDPKIDKSVQIITDSAQSKNIDTVMSNAFGFGGHNSTVIFKAV